MGIRPARAIRDPDKVAWTRYSKRKPRKSYIKAMPHQVLHQFRMGTKKDDYDVEVHLRSLQELILRQNAIESSRQTANRYLEKKIPQQYFFLVRVFPHHVIRENKMIAGAGADRLQKGMRRAFGRPTEKAARLDVGTDVFTIRTYKSHLEHVKKALDRAMKKLSGKYKIVVSEPTLQIY